MSPLYFAVGASASVLRLKADGVANAAYLVLYFLLCKCCDGVDKCFYRFNKR